MDIIREKNSYKGISLITSLCLRIGLSTLAFLILYFLVMSLFGLHKDVWFRALNIVILGWGIWVGLSHYRAMVRSRFDYFAGLRIGALITLIAVTPFAILTGIYLSLDSSFMNYLTHNLSIGAYLSPAVAAGAVLIEGLVSGLIFTFVVMPYFKEQ
ncbi:MAG TPA: hypothetical protein VNZ86_14390 [Bacteroidia bacterium]|nr:hypothetical protein [Bacteroidia bacterium]